MSFIKRGDGEPILHLIKSTEQLSEAEKKTAEVLKEKDSEVVEAEKKSN